jgi:hypothetical protein
MSDFRRLHYGLLLLFGLFLALLFYNELLGFPLHRGVTILKGCHG